VRTLLHFFPCASFFFPLEIMSGRDVMALSTQAIVCSPIPLVLMTLGHSFILPILSAPLSDCVRGFRTRFLVQAVLFFFPRFSINPSTPDYVLAGSRSRNEGQSFPLRRLSLFYLFLSQFQVFSTPSFPFPVECGQSWYGGPFFSPRLPHFLLTEYRPPMNCRRRSSL